MTPTTPPPTPETDVVVANDTGDNGFLDEIVKTCRRLERERDEARDQLEAMERAGAEQARRADENLEWALRAKREAQEQLKRTFDELYEEQQKHGITKAHLTECQMQIKAMREAIKEVSLQLTFAEKVSGASVLHIYVYDALTKLQPFIANE